MNALDTLFARLEASITNRLKTMGENLQPISQEQMDAIRDAVTLELVAQLASIESTRDAALAKSMKLDAALELSQSFRKNLS